MNECILVYVASICIACHFARMDTDTRNTPSVPRPGEAEPRLYINPEPLFGRAKDGGWSQPREPNPVQNL